MFIVSWYEMNRTMFRYFTDYDDAILCVEFLLEDQQENVSIR